MKFENVVVEQTIDCLLEGKDYRAAIVNDINTKFFSFTIDFFKAIVAAKMNETSINIDWYKKYFLNDSNLDKDQIAWNACLNMKTISNICKTSSKQVVIDMSIANYDYLKNLLSELEKDENKELNIEIKITKNKVSVELSLSESLLVINALATRKIALRGGAWSSIGKSVEKPLLVKLCQLCKVKDGFYNAKHFVKDKNKEVDREVDFILYDDSKKEFRCEVKLMGKGNPESADAVIARDSDVFIADTLSEQNKNQLNQRNVLWLELKGHSKEDIIKKFKDILDKLKVPYYI